MTHLRILQRTWRRRGFTLIELLVTMGILGVIMLALTGIFGEFMRGSAYARLSQQAAEDGQFVMNRIGKVLRTSTLISIATESVVVYDYSQSQCTRYRLVNQKILEDIRVAADPSGCTGFDTTSELSTVPVTDVRFAGNGSDKDAKTVGAVSVMMVLQRTPGPAVRMQTTLSLRDYEKSGLL